MRYLNKFDLRQHEFELQLSNDHNRYLPESSIVLTGPQIFTIFKEGTSWEDVDKDGRTVEKELTSDWYAI